MMRQPTWRRKSELRPRIVTPSHFDRGRPHHYRPSEPEWWSDAVYELRPIDDETFQLAMEHWQIWRRWEVAFHSGKTDLETHPALPEDRLRFTELEALLASRLPPQGDPIVLIGLFRGIFFGRKNDMKVAWFEPCDG
jgi:hypothetical protein